MTVPDYRLERLAALRQQTSDRPAHLAYLNELIGLWERGEQDSSWPASEGAPDSLFDVPV